MKNKLFPLWVILDLLIFVAAASLWIAAPEFKTLTYAVTIFAITLGFLLLLVRFDEIRLFVRSHYFEKVLYHTINMILIMSILGVLNYLGNRNFQEFDLTKEHRNSLTDQTKKILEMVKSPLKLTLFAKREEWEPMLNLLRLYRAQSKQIELEAIDTDSRPDLVKANGISRNGTVVIDYQSNKSQFVLMDELSVTNSLLRVLRSEKVTLYLVTGHQELSCDETSQEGLSMICEKLRDQNYDVKALDLAKAPRVPADATGVLILGPIAGFLRSEIDILKDYVNEGGNLFIALAPAFKAEVYDNLVGLLRPFGLELGKDIVIDRLSTVQGTEATIPIVSKYNQGPITNGFKARTIFPLSSSVRIIPGNTSAQIIAESSPFPGSWAETNLKAVTEGKATFEANSDLKGPVGLLGVAEGDGKKANRVVLLGSSSFLINAYQNQSGNTTLFLNALSWMVNDEGIISFNRPGIEEDPVILSAQHIQIIFVISILVVPIIFFGTAIFVYRRRRLL